MHGVFSFLQCWELLVQAVGRTVQKEGGGGGALGSPLFSSGFLRHKELIKAQGVLQG